MSATVTTTEIIRSLQARERLHGTGHIEHVQYGPRGIELLMALDSRAANIRSWGGSTVLPGLLQTRDYIMATTRQAFPHLPDQEIRRQSLLKSARVEAYTALLSERPAPMSLFVVSAAALERPVGGVDIHLAQLRHIHRMSRLPGVRLLILPSGVIPPGFAEHCLMYTLRPDVQGTHVTQVGYVESLFDGRFSWRHDHIHRMMLAFRDMELTASPEQASRTYLERLISSWQQESASTSSRPTAATTALRSPSTPPRRSV